MPTTKTPDGLAAHARAQVGQFYWYGTFGQAPTLALLDQKRRQYPKQITAERYDYAKQYHVGRKKRVYDCAGLVKSYWMTDAPDAPPKYDSAYDHSAAMLRSACAVKGKIESLPERPGMLVFIGTGHVGVYLGGGRVAEARGFSFGVVETRLDARPWDTWGRLNWFNGQTIIIEEEQTLCQCPCGCCEKMRRNGSHWL